VITVSAGEPTSSGTPSTVVLAGGPGGSTTNTQILGNILATTSFPGTITYVVQSAGTYSFRWFVNPSASATWTVSCVPAGEPAAAATDLQILVSSFELESGLSTALQSKLDEVRAALAAGDVAGACTSLQAFMNQVAAQTGKKLTTAQAQQLTSVANQIRTLLGC
jgi:hypothetical protein